MRSVRGVLHAAPRTARAALRLAVAAGRLMAGLGLAANVVSAHAQTLVTVPSLDAASGHAIPLPGFWFEAPSPSPAPAVVMLHGCGGTYAQGGAATQRLSSRMRDYAVRLNAMGVHALVVDSLTPRNELELCSQKLGARKVTQRERRLDALGALQWLSKQPKVTPERMGLLGWSHGGSAVLAATDRAHEAVKAAPARASLAVAFYPGCAAALASGYQAAAPLLVLVGEADDWTPAQPCKDLAAKNPSVQLVAYPGAYHGFDSKAPLRLLRNVPNGVNPGQGVHVGGQDTARLDAERQLEAFFTKHWGVVKP